MVSHCLKVEKGKIIQTKSLPGLYITRAYSGSDRRKGGHRDVPGKGFFTIEAALLFPMVVCFLVISCFSFVSCRWSYKWKNHWRRWQKKWR